MASDAHNSSPHLLKRATLRQATVIFPDTGERATRRVTLRGAPSTTTGSDAEHAHDEHTPLLPLSNNVNHTESANRLSRLKNSLHAYITSTAGQLAAFAHSREAKNILKCSFAYFLASLAVFIPWFTTILGSSDSKHLVANIVIWYNPARSSGSIDQGIIYASIAFCFSALVSYLSMITATAFDHAELLSPWGHAFILIVFCGGSLGVMSWTKQRMHDFLVSVSVSLASIPIVTVLTRDLAIQEGYVSHTVVVQTLRMAMMGIMISTIVTVLVWPIRARADLRGNLVKATNAFSDVLSNTASAFLSGQREDMGDADKMTSSLTALEPNLKEARNEHYLLGTERQYHIEERLVTCVQELAQDIGGLRSAASTQFDLLDEGIVSPSPLETGLQQSQAKAIVASSTVPPQSAPAAAVRSGLSDLPISSSPASVDSFKSIVTVIDRAAQQGQDAPEIDDYHPRGEHAQAQSDVVNATQGDSLSAATAADIFNTFVANLGPHMKSLAYTLKTILSELPFGPAPSYDMSRHPTFKPSLLEAIRLFAENRKEALSLVYRSRAVTLARSVQVAADFEEVAASCGHFSSSLQDLAENITKYLDILDELHEETTDRSRSRSWTWLLFWRRQRGPSEAQPAPVRNQSKMFDSKMAAWFRLVDDVVLKLVQRPSPSQHKELPRSENAISTHTDLKNSMPVYAASFQSTFRYKLWKSLRAFRRDDIRFAIKVGAGGAAFASLAYWPATAPYFYAWRLEWSMATYMFVCNMTIGGANLTVLGRIYGTILGAGLALIAWFLGDDNPYILAFLSWIVSLICFALVILKDQGPMGRFMLLTYNLVVLYSYSLSVNDQDRDEDEGGVHPAIFDIVRHRVIAISAGILWALFITRAIWPISAREKLKSGLSLIWLRMGLIWKRGPLTVMRYQDEPHEEEIRRDIPPSYVDLRQELKLREFAGLLNTMRVNAESEFTLRRPFQSQTYDNILKSTNRMLDAFHALNVVVNKDLKATPGEADLLRYTTRERQQLAKRISHLLSVLASSIKLEYPMTDTLPDVAHTRDRLLARMFAFRHDESVSSNCTDEDFEILYCYALVTGQLAKEIEYAGKELTALYGVMDENILNLG